MPFFKVTAHVGSGIVVVSLRGVGGEAPVKALLLVIVGVGGGQLVDYVLVIVAVGLCGPGLSRHGGGGDQGAKRKYFHFYK